MCHVDKGLDPKDNNPSSSPGTYYTKEELTVFCEGLWQ